MEIFPLRLKEIAMRLLGLLIWLPLVLSGQSPQKPIPTIPATSEWMPMRFTQPSSLAPH